MLFLPCFYILHSQNEEIRHLTCYLDGAPVLHCFKGIFRKAYAHDLTGMHDLTGNYAYYDFFRKTHVPLYLIT